MDYICFIHSSGNGHLGCFHVLAVIDSACCEHWGACFFLNYNFIGIGLMNHMATIFSFLRNLYTTFHSGCTTYIPTHRGGEFPFLHIQRGLFKINIYRYAIVILYTLKLYSVTCQLYLTKAEGGSKNFSVTKPLSAVFF